jgi:hypothetical protein
MRALLVLGGVAISFAFSEPVLSQTSPQVPRPDTPQSESTGPQDPRSTGSTTRSNEPLSERLAETDGVIRPREDVAPDMAIRPPDPGTTRVIPPPGSPGGNQAIVPK